MSSRRRAATLPTCANGKLENGSRGAGAHEVAHRRPELDLRNRFVQQDQTALLRLLEAIRGSIASDQDGWNAFVITTVNTFSLNNLGPRAERMTRRGVAEKLSILKLDQPQRLLAVGGARRLSDGRRPGGGAASRALRTAHPGEGPGKPARYRVKASRQMKRFALADGMRGGNEASF
jgi:hypothetical protein